MVGYRSDQKGAGSAQDTAGTRAKVKGAISDGGTAPGPTAPPAEDVLQRVYGLPPVPGRGAFPQPPALHPPARNTTPPSRPKTPRVSPHAKSKPPRS